ncbi:hypothetical protein HPO96_19630 [Kribbella sandramycini]|uniref:Uncharacterized protein n=1 Tax=Kribbella sandramycini TaxID=60450 RepID=A0A7Y4L2T9_9ACTN|nr:hypothetical protein [Kribbella sandramycini]MBB6564761.1 hypothetical protein [Kribbella sandramycini]NOL42462.1 hypothetical protein [Kribbella sandramycini]
MERSTYHVEADLIEFAFEENFALHAEVGHKKRLLNRPVVYLDQVHWVSLARALYSREVPRSPEITAAEQLIKHARDGRLILPLSAGHVVETAKTGGRRRVDLARCQLELSRGWQMLSPLRTRAAELTDLLSGRLTETYARDRREALFRLDPDAIWGRSAPTPKNDSGLPPTLQDISDRMTWISSLFEMLLAQEPTFPTDGHAMASKWGQSIHELAIHMRSNPHARRYRRDLTRTRFLSDMQIDLANAAKGSGLSTSEFGAWLKDSAEKDLALLPHLARLREIFHLRIINADDKWESNDLIDMLYLSCSAGYAEVVVAEKKFGNYLLRADPRVPPGAAVFLRLADALPEIERLLG